MKNMPRIHRNGSKKAVKTQAKTKSSSAKNAPVDLIIPLNCAREADDALSIMLSVGSAATTLAMMNADQIKTSARDFDGWESMDTPDFGEGSLELARIVVADFQEQISNVASGSRAIMQKIKDFNQPVAPDFTPEKSQLWRSYYKADLHNFEDAVGSLRNCLEVQGLLLSDRTTHQIAHHTSFALSNRLESALDSLWAALHGLHSSFSAIASTTSQTKELRRAA